MQTIEINGISYVSARELEKEYNISRKRCWQLISKSGLSYVKLLQSHFYEMQTIKVYLDNLLKK